MATEKTTREAMPETETERFMEWLVSTHYAGATYLSIGHEALARGTEIAIDPAAWDNTLAAIEWAVSEARAGRVQWTKRAITEEDAERVRKLRRLGAAVLAGAERSPDLLRLTEACLELLAGPGWRNMVAEMAQRDPWIWADDD